MAATPSSAAHMSDAEPPSSPVHIEKSFMASVAEDDDTRVMATPEPSERQPRGKKRGRDDGPNGNPIGKIRHLKKEDGEPLWRKDIQYDFLRAVFDNDLDVFTNSYEKDRLGKQCFADLYIDTMSRSSKTSKVLRDKLLSDREAAKGMAMVCLLVNIGRMNTTLNFFPEMRAQLRTYHAIPSLQARQDPHAYKQLQDAPRLKSILKGGSDDRPEPTSLDDVKNADVPRTNPVNLLFLICQAASKIAELHFPPGQEFHDLIMKTNYSSESRARAFLWLMWFYLESDFTEEGCDENPFGPGVDYDVDVANQGVPRLVYLTPDQLERENVDTQEEIEFGYAKQKMRAKIIEAEQHFIALESQPKRGGRGRALVAGDDLGPTTGILPRIRPSKNESDLDSVRSTPPPRALARQSGLFSSTGRRGPHSLKYQVFDGSSPAADRAIEGVVARKPRPPTAHQLAVERNRSQRVEYILDRGLRRSHHRSRRTRRPEGAIIRALPRLAQMQDPFDDSEEDEVISHGKLASSILNGADSQRLRERGYGGLASLKDETDDFGEQVSAYAAAFRRTMRRLHRWESSDSADLGVILPVKRPKLNGAAVHDEDEDEDGDGDGYGYADPEGSPSKEMVDPAETEDENEPVTNGADTPMDDADELDEVDKELLGLGEGEPDEGEVEAEAEVDEGEEELDDVDKTLLGLDADSDSD
ncbi:hypothetical protein C8A05DRAFT_16023 [Staphylotrichum tortipilum]|uniref:Ino eighty subunit 1 n=1 Tax=Staphylotrichum tortipilum TaxID=2831512 RepID=A0AAN6MKE7_9PEZI|nr:hypothetical protein C8A05DRAFT_16023 [Staphylotrichum longicolle]